MIAADTGIDLARLLLDLLIIITAAKAAAELAERLRIPAVLGEIFAGVLIGPSALRLVHLTGERGVTVSFLAEVGVLLLLLQVGMEMDLKELGKVGRSSLLVAVVGVVVPFGAGIVVGLAFGQSTNTAIFVGAALTATSVGITARVFGDLRALATTEARIVLGAAVADDVLGLIILTVVVKVISGGSVSAGTILSTLGLALLFLGATGVVGVVAVPRLLELVHRKATSPAAVTVAALAITIAFAELADLAKLAFIIGAFMAGLGLGRSRQHERLATDLSAVGNVFVPIFFAQIGINADLGAMFKPSVLGVAAVLCIVAVLGKLASAVGTFGSRVDRVLVGIGMIPRGEVGLIFASIGLSNGVLNADEYGALILVVLVTTIITPPLLRWRLGSTSSLPIEQLPTTDEPAGGWLTTSNGEIHLHGSPPVELTVPLALRTAERATRARPSSELLDWFGTRRNVPIEWNHTDTSSLVRLLRGGDPRSFRFLEVSGVLERTLPEIAEAMGHRRADPSDLDPAAALRFPVVERLDALEAEFGFPNDELVLAALVADASADVVDSAECSLSLAQRLVPDAEATRIVSILDDAHLLRAGTRDSDALDRSATLQLATHLASSAHARDAHQLAVSLGQMPRWQRELLDERLRQIVEALDHPEVTGSEANNIAGARRQAAERLIDDPVISERLRFATNSYLLAHEPEELARQARLLEPLPRRGSVRVSVGPEPEPDRWKVDFACRDADALLARLAGVLAHHGLDVEVASIATWPDGGVLDSFIVHSKNRPTAKTLALDLELALNERVRLSAMPTLTFEFDNDALPWHTSVVVTGPNRPGALQAVSAAFAVADVTVHAARISTTNEGISDRFAVSDPIGRKLDEATMTEVRQLLADGPKRRHLRRKL